MPVTTWWGLSVALLLIIGGGYVFRRRVMSGEITTVAIFRRWTEWTALVAATLVLASALPTDQLFSTPSSWQGRIKDVSVVFNAIAPLVLTLSLTLISIFYSVGEWYDKAHRLLRDLGISDAQPDRKGRQQERGVEWQNLLKSTQNRAVIVGTTLGGWFVSGWEDTRVNLLEVLTRAQVQVLLADPSGGGFELRASDPGELAEAEVSQQARTRAKQVYERIAWILANTDFAPHVTSGRLAFYTYRLAPLSVVWIDDEMRFTPYLPCKGDKSCPEFKLISTAQLGSTVNNCIDELIKHSTRITTRDAALALAAQCE